MQGDATFSVPLSEPGYRRYVTLMIKLKDTKSHVDQTFSSSNPNRKKFCKPELGTWRPCNLTRTPLFCFVIVDPQNASLFIHTGQNCINMTDV